MSTHILCLVVALSAAPEETELPPVYEFSPQFEVAIRGQSPVYDEDPLTGGPSGSLPSGAPTIVDSPAYYGPSSFGPYGGPVISDPFLGNPNGGVPGAAGQAFGMNGPQPYRFGWQVMFDNGWMPEENVSQGNATGKFGVYEADLVMQSYNPIGPNWVFGLSPQFNYRSWSGPGGTGLPGSVYRLGLGLALEMPVAQPVSVKLNFTPAVASDFNGGMSGDAWQFDAGGVLIFQTIPGWQLVVGAEYWDRVDDMVVPYGGVVWVPNDMWEFRITWPESRVQLFLGNNWFGHSSWLYARGEYHVEAYEIREELTSVRDQIQIEDYRVLIGLRGEWGWTSAFIEGGWVFGRNTDFQGNTPGFDISDGFIGRFGFRF